ncbi:MAG: DUF7670 domain-containing protein [Bacteroidales bacterium]
MKAKFFLWTPRILTILAILFMMMFSLDVFGGNEPIYMQLVGFLIHNIPAFGLMGVLAIAWTWELTGGIVFIVCSIAMSIFFRAFQGNPASLIVVGPFFIIGILFLIHHFYFKRIEKQGA